MTFNHWVNHQGHQVATRESFHLVNARVCVVQLIKQSIASLWMEYYSGTPEQHTSHLGGCSIRSCGDGSNQTLVVPGQINATLTKQSVPLVRAQDQSIAVSRYDMM